MSKKKATANAWPLSEHSSGEARGHASVRSRPSRSAFFGHEKLMPIFIGMTWAGKGDAASSAARQPEMNALRRKKMCR